MTKSDIAKLQPEFDQQQIKCPGLVAELFWSSLDMRPKT